MFCGICGSAIPINAVFCPRCGSPVPLVKAPVSVSPTPISSAPPSTPTWAVVASVAYLIVVLGSFAAHWENEQRDWASAIGYEIGTALIPAVIVLIYYKIQKRKASAARVMSVLASWI